MTIRSRLLLMLLMLGILFVGVMTVLTAEAAIPADKSYHSPPPLRLDSFDFRVNEATLPLIRNGCLEVMVLALPDGESDIEVYATCIEWMEIRPASQ